MSTFLPGREQDASATIRGFKYQIQVTVRRWLNLPPDDTLYLECGEDIDRAARSPNAASAERELEQIKARGRNITIRTADVLQALANFASHISANPGMSLRFRFTTTAVPGRERGLSTLPPGLKALEVWKDLAAKGTWTPDDQTLATQLGKLLHSMTRPPECSSEEWVRLMGIVDGEGPIAWDEFIKRFEWSYGASQPEDLTEEIVAQIGTLPGDTGATDPGRRQRYEQLMLTVLNILSGRTNGPRLLSRELLQEQLSRPTLADHDRVRLRILEGQFAEAAEQMGSLHAALDRVEKAQGRLTLFGQAATALRGVDFTPPLSGMPPMVARVAHRASTVSSMVNQLGAACWLNIFGDYGSGKSQLSLLIAERTGGIVLGASMRGMTERTAEHGLVAILGMEQATRAGLTSGTPGIVLLDDLPDYESGGCFEIALVTFAKLVKACGRRVVTTSRRILPASTVALFGPGLSGESTPPFTDTDAAELFRAYNLSPDITTETRVRTMNAMCVGHPVLLTALAEYMLSRPGQSDQALVDAFVGDDHRAHIDLETARKVIATVEPESCRHLLYRMASARVALNSDEMRALAAVRPPIAESIGCIGRLVGLWLRPTGGSRYEVSPLALHLRSEVPPSINREVHREVARLVFARRTLGIYEFMRAITSMMIAGDNDAAAMHLAYGCTRLPNRPYGYEDLNVLLLFPPHEPQLLSHSAELPLRAVQVIAASLKAIDVAPYVQRIEVATAATVDGIATSAILAGSTLLSAAHILPIELVLLGSRLIERFRSSSEVADEMRKATDGILGTSHLLIPIGGLRTWHDVDKYLEYLESIDSSRLTEFMANAEARHGMQVVLNGPMFDAKSNLTRDAFVRLDEILKRCLGSKLYRLAGYAAGGRLIVLGEYDKQMDAMLEEGKRALALVASDPAAVSIVNVRIGQQLYFAGRSSEAMPYLASGLNVPEHIVGLERANRLVDLMGAQWDIGMSASAAVDDLSKLVRGQPFALPEVMCQMEVQAATVLWHEGRRSEAHGAFERAVVKLLNLGDSPKRRQLGVGMIHAMSYCIAIAETGAPPPPLPNGEAFIEAHPRIFTGLRDGMVQIWRVRQGDATLQWMLGRLADAVGAQESATVWLERAYEAAVQAKAPGLLMLLTPPGIAADLRNHQWNDAIEAAVTFGRARVCCDDPRYEGANIVEDYVEFDSLQSSSDLEERRKADVWSLWLLARAVLCELAPAIGATGTWRVDAIGLAESIEKVVDRLELQEAWKAFAGILRMSVADAMNRGQHSAALKAIPGAGASHVELLAHGLLSFHPDAQSGQAAVSHAGTLYALAKALKPMQLSLERYANAVIQHWVDRVATAGFHFSAPREVSKTLASFSGLPALARARAVVRAVLLATGGTVHADLDAWLTG